LVLKDFVMRIFKPEDLESIMEINLKTLPENYSSYFYLELYENFPKVFLVAEADNKIVGYIMCRIETGRSEFKRTPFSFTRKGHMVSIAVLPEYRRRGIGSALITEAMHGMIEYNASECFLEVRITNEQAINLYKKLGFQIVNTIRDYYHDGEDAALMAKKLTAL
jgi:ribosomal-protein-alanine N-acetyltransferase